MCVCVCVCVCVWVSEWVSEWAWVSESVSVSEWVSVRACVRACDCLFFVVVVCLFSSHNQPPYQDELSENNASQAQPWLSAQRKLAGVSETAASWITERNSQRRRRRKENSPMTKYSYVQWGRRWKPLIFIARAPNAVGTHASKAHNQEVSAIWLSPMRNDNLVSNDHHGIYACPRSEQKIDR